MLRLLTIAGSDSGGGAGIQADLKTFAALGAYGMSALTAVTAQNTRGVDGIWDLPPEAVRRQILAVADDIGVDAVKIGMVHTAAIVRAVAAALDHLGPVPVVLDPVMRAKGGHPLIQADAEQAIREELLPRATVVTPNVPEAEALTGLVVRSRTDQAEAGRRLCDFGSRWALVKGGHLDGPEVADVLEGPTSRIFVHPRLDTPHTHGTGCTLSSAIAVGLARGLAVPDAVDLAERYLAGAIRHAPGLGSGHGPLHHHWGMPPWM
ncbi:MAG: bifunctional hydroxymethylpyrimidine kinase/phosphomethylpyrimidine kinase [Actinomycetia bacterium]|nr:bifunctional hydroxymethylpyrimidine kinase/phosphomethylpyrimidine kinase [Actinomycetes bacterium]